MISGPEVVMLHPEEFGLYEAVVQAARDVTAALDHGRDPSRKSLRELQQVIRDMKVDDAQQEAWDQIVRDA